jgi:beta-lactamase class A
MMLNRRHVLTGGAAIIVTGCAAQNAPVPLDQPSAKLAELEAKAGGRLGVFILDVTTGRTIGHRVDERFGMCSTFKLALAGAILHRSDKGQLNLEKQLNYSAADMIANSPVTAENLAKSGKEIARMTIAELSQATQETSDNTAANLLMKELGGPAALTQIFEAWGDGVTRVDRYEPEMNRVPPGEIRDTTTPRAYAKTVAKLLVGDALLKPQTQAKLIGWMVDTQTGAKRLRAGLPSAWKSGDKTGTGFHKSYTNKYNDVAIFWPPARPPVIVTCFYEGPVFFDDTRDVDQAVLAEVGRIAAAQAVDWHGGLD